MFEKYKKTLFQVVNKSKSKYFPNRTECIRIISWTKQQSKSTNILEKLHRTPTLQCSARLTLDGNGYPHLQRHTAKRQNDSYGRENMWVNPKGRIRSVLILAVLLKLLTNPATACQIRCETRPAGMTVSGNSWQLHAHHHLFITISCLDPFTSFLRYF